MIGFAGPRVVNETTHQDLPPGFQTAEFMMEHGLVDLIVAPPRDARTPLQAPRLPPPDQVEKSETAA